MNATITALRPGRTVALVQRPRRKMHLASIAAGESSWLAFCDRPVLAAGATPSNPDMATALEQHGAALCADCTRLLMLAIYVGARFDPIPVRKAAAR